MSFFMNMINLNGLNKSDSAAVAQQFLRVMFNDHVYHLHDSSPHEAQTTPQELINFHINF